MNLNFVAEFLNENLYNFDYSILKFWHSFAELTNNNLTWLFKLITFITEKGIIFIIFAIFLMMFKKTRKIGICMFGAIGLGAIITNFVLKDNVERLRPFLINSDFKSWWTYLGKPLEEGFSFPSGHTTAASAAMISFFMLTNKKHSWKGLLIILLVGISRNYLMAHYPTDVIAAIIIGFVSSIVAYFITKLIYYILDKYNNKLFKFIKNFNIIKG